jgi:hypothetical protein
MTLKKEMASFLIDLLLIEKMLVSLKMKDFLEFEDFFKDNKIEIYEKHARDNAASEDYIRSFQKLSDKID